MRIVVTGGAGFIGRHVVTELLSNGHDVAVLDSLRPDVHRRAPRRQLRGSDGAAATGSDEAAARTGAADRAADVRADVRDIEAVRGALRGADAIVHLAAKVGLGLGMADMDDYVSSNDLGTAVMLRVAAEHGIGRFVQASSMVVYGEGRYECAEHGVVPPGPRRREDLDAGRFEPPCPRCGQPLRPDLVGEDAPLDPRNAYAATKVTQEHLAATWARETGGTAYSLRLHNVYGPGMPRDTPYAGVASIFASCLDRGDAPQVFEDGEQRRDFVHVSDVARAFAQAVVVPSQEAGQTRCLNVGSGAVTTVGGLARALSTARRGPEPVVTGRYRVGDVRHVTASSERIADELGWVARIPLAEGLAGLQFR